jgi:hypothetical protein
MEYGMSLGMLKLFRLFFIFALSINIFASNKSMDFDLIKKGEDDNNTLLIVGGIQGDEPGGFIAASLIATHYTVTKGSVWVVPNLNFYSIIKRSRGPYGDMNRKFAALAKDDPEYELIQRIKGYIQDPAVKMILNLHDGSGFFRDKYIDKYHNPRRWGQSIVIDQEYLKDLVAYPNLNEIALQVTNHLNENLLKQEDFFRVKNTKTRFEKTYEQTEMAKTLTYFAITHKKAAFGHETSKSLSVERRVYYKLLALEEYMRIMGIEFKRTFDMNPNAIKNIIDNDIFITFYNDKIKLPLSQIRRIIKYFPVKKDGTLEYTPSSPLLTIIKTDNIYTIHYGNRELAKIKPDFLDMVNVAQGVKLKIDGEDFEVPFGSIINVKDNFYIYPTGTLRVNVIGYINKKQKNEAGLVISKKDILKRYSVDKHGKIYRIEFYDNKKFIGMIMVDFNDQKKSDITYNSYVMKKKIKS